MRFKVSRRTLYALFEESSLSISGLIRELRLQRSARELLDPAPPGVLAVALRWGFNDASHFSRLFNTASASARVNSQPARTTAPMQPRAAPEMCAAFPRACIGRLNGTRQDLSQLVPPTTVDSGCNGNNPIRGPYAYLGHCGINNRRAVTSRF
nr:helix-turn-helix domain-containing protein [Salinicola acroporae]